MLKLTYANRTEDLLEALAKSLEDERQKHTIWQPIQLVVPNPNVKRYLLDGLGRRLGVLANYKVNYLDGLWRSALEQMDPPIRLWNRHALQGAILSVLTDKDALDASDLASLKKYLQGDGADLKLLQLAEKTSGLLEDYSLTRPDWARAWAKDKSVSGAPDDLEGWQRGLWNRILAATKGGPVRWATLAELLQDGTFNRIALPPRVHVFGLSYAAEVYLRAFETASAKVDINLYALNPCQEFWDDLPSEAEVRREALRQKQSPVPAAPDDPYALETGEDPLLLRRWGRPGRENIRLLNEISGCDFENAFPEEPEDPKNLLESLQDNLRFRKTSASADPDDSLRILACPSPAREAEVVASEIWQLMAAAPTDHPLRFSEIAVVVPPGPGLRSTYLDHLRMAFDATAHIPMVVVDAPTPALASLLDGAELLLDLPTGRGSRRDLLRALTHPSVRSRFPETDADVWARWSDSAGIVRGLAQEDLQNETRLDPGFLHWEQGLERLALSAFMPPGSAWVGEGFDRPTAQAGDALSTSHFVDRASTLVRQIRTLRHLDATPAEWAERLTRFLLSYLGSDESPDAGGRAQLAKAFQSLRSLVPEGMPAPKLNFRQARDLARLAVGGIRDGAGGRPHQGVVVGSYAPMRALPFRAVFLMGLGEGQFPSPEERQPLDLRNAQRRAGDVGAAERDRYLFLEMLLGARETLCLTYPSEDPVSREKRLPSSLLLDLVEALAPLTLEQLQQTHPRYRFDETYFPHEGAPACASLAPQAFQEAQAQAAGALLATSTLGLDEKPWSSLALPVGLRSQLDPLLSHCPPPPRAVRPDVPLTLRLTHLRAWLECPLQGTARTRLRMGDDEEELAELEEEVLGTSNMVQAILRRSTLLKIARKGTDLETTYEAFRRELLRSGKTAPGIFGAPEVQEDLKLLGHQHRALKGESIRLIRFGPSFSADEEADEVPLPLELTVQVYGSPLRVRLVGSLQPQVGSRSLLLSTRAGVQAKGGVTTEFRKKVLRAYLDHHLLALCAKEPLAHGVLGLSGANDKGKSPRPYRSTIDFPAISAEEARQRLEAWITELLETQDPVLLPIEAVFNGSHKNPEDLHEWVMDKVDSPRDFSTFKTGPLRHPERYAVDPTPAATAERRLQHFLDLTRSGTREEVS